jgi:hypothetical protein
MTDYFITVDDEHIKREKAKARELRLPVVETEVFFRICYYCEEFKPADLTMDHLI